MSDWTGRLQPRIGGGELRLAALRILVGAYATVWTTLRAPHLVDTIALEGRRLDPVGPLAWLSGPVASPVVLIAVIVTPMAGIAATLGWRYRVSAPTLALAFLFVTTYRNSWGQLFHTENLASLHLVVLALAPADRRWSLRRGDADAPTHAQWAVDAMATMTVCTYFVAGVAKLKVAGWAWVDGDVLLHQVAFDNARKDVIGEPYSPFASVLVDRSWLTPPAAWASMVIELGAPLALLGGRLARWWSGAAWLFHVAILVLMAILFPYHLLGIALAPLLPVERAMARVAARVGARTVRGRRPERILSARTSPKGAT
jgi:hypothetical protein